MRDPSLALLAFVFLTFTLAGLVKGVTGMGLPTVAMAMLATLVAPHEAAALLLVPSLVTNVWQFAAGASPIDVVRRFWPMMGAVAAATVLSASALAGDDARHAAGTLGAVLLVYAAFGLSGRRFSVGARGERWANAPIGLLTGVVAGSTGVAVMPSAPYLQALGLEKDELVQALGLCFTVSTIALGVGLAANGALGAPALGLSAAAILPAALGMALGQKLRGVISPATFKTVFFTGLFALGFYLVAEAA